MDYRPLGNSDIRVSSRGFMNIQAGRPAGLKP